MRYLLRRHTLFIAFLAVIGLSLAATGAHASGVCPPGTDACLIVNTVQQTNKRDTVLTLREALLVAHGELGRAALTPSEQLQVHEATALGLAGNIEVNFDATVFPPGAGGVITLLPPGLGGGDAPGQTTLPPGLGGGDDLVNALPPGLGGGDAPGVFGTVVGIGGGVVGDQRVPVTVIINGAQLGPAYAGLGNTAGGTLRDLSFHNFAGHAIELETPAALNLVLSGVTFQNNAVDIVAVGTAY